MTEYTFKFSESASLHLGIIRIIAAHLIVIGHGIMGRVSPIGGAILGAPGLGVFFCMSGLLISYSTLRRMKDKKYEFKRFVVKRFARIYPALGLALVIMIVVDFFYYVIFGNPDVLNSYNIPTLLWNILILQDSWWGPTCFGTSRQLWPFPLFWWTYLIFGWLLLGFRNTKKKYVYVFVSLVLTFPVVFIILGPWTQNKLDYVSLWILGVLFGYTLNRLDHHIQKKAAEKDTIPKKSAQKYINKIKYGSLALSLVLYVLSAIRLLTHQDPYGTLCLFLLNGSFFFFLIFSQYIQVKIPEKLKKGVNFLASYTYSLFLVQYAAGYIIFFFGTFPAVIYIILIYLLSNFIAIAIAYFSELRVSKIENYLLRKFHLVNE